MRVADHRHDNRKKRSGLGILLRIQPARLGSADATLLGFGRYQDSPDEPLLLRRGLAPEARESFRSQANQTTAYFYFEKIIERFVAHDVHGGPGR